MSKKKSRYALANDFLKVAINIATSDSPVTDDRLIVGEMCLEMYIALIKLK